MDVNISEGPNLRPPKFEKLVYEAQVRIINTILSMVRTKDNYLWLELMYTFAVFFNLDTSLFILKSLQKNVEIYWRDKTQKSRRRTDNNLLYLDLLIDPLKNYAKSLLQKIWHTLQTAYLLPSL